MAYKPMGAKEIKERLSKNCLCGRDKIQVLDTINKEDSCYKCWKEKRNEVHSKKNG